MNTHHLCQFISRGLILVVTVVSNQYGQDARPVGRRFCEDISKLITVNLKEINKSKTELVIETENKSGDQTEQLTFLLIIHSTMSYIVHVFSASQSMAVNSRGRSGNTADAVAAPLQNVPTFLPDCKIITIVF
jgi:hypothetical protein